MARAASGERRAAIMAATDVWHRTQAVLASSLAIASMMWTKLQRIDLAAAIGARQQHAEQLGLLHRRDERMRQAPAALDLVGGTGDERRDALQRATTDRHRARRAGFRAVGP